MGQSSDWFATFCWPLWSVEFRSTFLLEAPQTSVCKATNKIEEFDPGSARTLAAWLKHASRTRTEISVSY